MDRSPVTSPLKRPAPEPQHTGSGAYRLAQRLSQSPSARVYLAQAVANGETVVVKQPASSAATEHEAILLRHLNGKRAPLLLASDDVAGQPALVMERLAGRPLLDLVRDDPQLARSARFRRILDGLAATLAALHAQGIVHGDLKPDHVIVDHDDDVRLIDFSAAAFNARQPPGTGDTAWLTPGFAAPEQFAADSLPDQRSDIFAFGAVAFWAATGRVPPQAGDGIDVRAGGAQLRDAHLPEDLSALILACLQPEPAHRPRGAAMLRDLLAGGASAPPETASARASAPDEVPPTLRVRRRRIATPPQDSAAVGGGGPGRRRNVGRLMLWLFLLALVAGVVTIGVWQGKPLYEKHFKTTWLIDSSGKGDAMSLVEAVARAGDEVTFLLAPGEHVGVVVQDGRYRIQPSESDAAPPVILAGPAGCLSVINARLTVAGLVFRGTGGEGGRACIEQSGGELNILGSLMENLSGPGIVIGGGANARVAESTLVSIGEDAIRIERGSVLELHGTTIEQAGGNAVTVKSGAALTTRGNRITDAKGTGMLFTQGAQARLEGDLIQGSAASALEAASGAQVEARDVTLAASSGAGIFLHGGSRLRMAESRVIDNGLSGLFADGAAQVDMHDSVVTNNGEHGILCLSAQAGRLDRNSIARNGGYGLVLDPATRVDIGDNSLDANEAGPLMDARESPGEDETGGDETDEAGTE